jgi:hypothetical protein
LLFLDEQEFLKQVTRKEITNEKLETARKLKLIPRASQIPDPGKTRATEKVVNISQLK